MFLFDTQVFYFDRWLARITAQACRQPGLSYVFTELFNYEDAEIYVEERDHSGKPLDYTGMSFKDAIGQFTQSTLIGVVRKDSVDGSDRMYIAPNPDFEDVVQACCAGECGVDAIVTRDKKGFIDSGILVYTPTELLERHAGA